MIYDVYMLAYGLSVEMFVSHRLLITATMSGRSGVDRSQRQQSARAKESRTYIIDPVSSSSLLHRPECNAAKGTLTIFAFKLGVGPIC